VISLARLYLKKALINEFVIDWREYENDWNIEVGLNLLQKSNGKYAQKVLVDAQGRLSTNDPNGSYLGTWPAETQFLGNKITIFAKAFRAISNDYRLRFKRISKSIKSMTKPKNKRGQPYRPSSVKNRSRKLRAHLLSSISNRDSRINSSCLSLATFFVIPLHQYDFVIAFIGNILFDPIVSLDKLPSNLCPHFLLSSSIVLDLLNNDLSLYDFHFSSNCFRNRLQGRQTEDYVQSKIPDLLKGWAVRSRLLPFIVAKPDFLFELPATDKDRVKLIEVKSAKDWGNTFHLIELKNDRAVAQIQVAMFVFQTTRSKMYVVKVNQHQDCPMFEILPADEIHYDGFVEKNVNKLILRYAKLILMPYLEYFFEIKLLAWERSNVSKYMNKLYQKRRVEIQASESLAELKQRQLKYCKDKREVCRNFI
jgi:hypothetical protein